MFESLEYEEFKKKGKKIIHWLPVGDLANAEVLMPDNKLVKGLCEKGKYKEGDVVQLERVGFCRLDKKDDKLVFWFAHR